MDADAGLQNYKILVEIFKGYLDTALTVHTSYYAFTGALAAYYLSHRNEHRFLRFSLFIPLFLGVALAVVSFTGMAQALTLKDKVNMVVKDLAMKGAPPVDILRQSLLLMGILDLIIFFCLLLLILEPAFIFGGPRQLWLPFFRRPSARRKTDK